MRESIKMTDRLLMMLICVQVNKNREEHDPKPRLTPEMLIDDLYLNKDREEDIPVA